MSSIRTAEWTLKKRPRSTCKGEQGRVGGEGQEPPAGGSQVHPKVILPARIAAAARGAGLCAHRPRLPRAPSLRPGGHREEHREGGFRGSGQELRAPEGAQRRAGRVAGARLTSMMTPQTLRTIPQAAIFGPQHSSEAMARRNHEAPDRPSAPRRLRRRRPPLAGHQGSATTRAREQGTPQLRRPPLRREAMDELEEAGHERSGDAHWPLRRGAPHSDGRR